jgi:hypothetical protein
MEAKGVATQILIAGATAVVTTTVAVLITSWLTKRSTTEDIASGKQPLPPGSTPKTDGPPIDVKPTGNPMPQPSPQPPPKLPPVSDLLSIANQIATVNPFPRCPEGMHYVPNNDPNTQKNIPYWCFPNL